MKQLILIILCSFLWLSCGGVKETVQVSGVSEDDIARSLVQQKGERPVINPESLKTKIPPQKIITTAKPAEIAPVLPKSVSVAPTQVKAEVKVPLADTTKLVADTSKAIDTVAIKTPPAAVVSKPQVVVSPPPIAKAPAEPQEVPVQTAPELGPSKELILQNLSFDDIYFNSGEWAMPSSSFNSNYYVTLGKLVKALKADPEIKIRISAYTDNEGDAQSEYQIAQKRALTFGKLLIELFPPDKRSEIAERIEINPVGSAELLVETPNNARRMLNRRVSFELFYGGLHNNPYSQYMDIKTVSIAAQKVKPATSTSSESLSIQQKLYAKAMALFEQKRYNESIDIFDEILQIDKKHPLADNAQFWIGEALYYQGRYQEALQVYQQVFGLGNRNKEAYAQLRLGYCYLRMGNKERAVEELKKVLQNYSRFPEEVNRAEMVLSKIQSD
jgi:outer membrane protein OmpA-like peptidoglycan-associated protein